MKVYNLTKAYVQRINQLSDGYLKVCLEDIQNLEDYPYLLIIQSTIENSIKISIYPLKKDKIVKVTFSSIDFSEEIYELITKILQNFQVIHTSGVLLIGKKLYYECYLNLSFDEIKVMNLKNSLDRVKNVFKKINIEEIGLIKN
ncbi:MAG: hypothetical protein ACFFEY_14145 [Candidatus Thorarchaeota archaeon]